ncbi:FixH family protein [Formosa sediminum]|uniref:FixH family protein n=1 Tax=Formosa sediminum TaxID=2594004 RepID=A0A516GS62_9FLAO|nr:FixH family protein [Formosa sediminum]QDO94355.1 FixH family protein [Formosa sediminum]
MKMNWGTGIVIAFACFIAFIMYFVVTMVTDNTYHHELVVEDYYKKELTLQSDIIKEENTLKLKENIAWSHNEDGLLLQFPKSLDASKISGTITLYRPSNKSLDFQIPIVLNNHSILIPKSKLVQGRWDLTVDWNSNNTSYLYKKSIVY